MTTYAWPSTRAFMPMGFTWSVKGNETVVTSILNGGTQTASAPGTRWSCMLSFDADAQGSRPQLEAFLAKCRRQHRIALHNLKRPAPAGTINLTGVTLNAAIAQFASSAVLAGCGASTTLKAGDMLGMPGQLLMVADDAAASAGGVMSVNFTHEIRSSYTAGAAVTLDKPTALFIQAAESVDFPAVSSYYSPMTVELMEVFS